MQGYVILCGVMTLMVGKGLTSSLEQMAEQLTQVGQEQEHALTEAVKHEAVQLEQDVLQETEILDTRTHERAQELAQQTQAEIKRALDRAVIRERDEVLEAHRISGRLKRQALEKINALVRQAEQEAYRLKKTQRKELLKLMLDEIASGERTAWKTHLYDEFIGNLGKLEAVIRRGEQPDGVAEFERLFKEQRTWFDASLTAVKSPHDAQYFVLFQKNIALRNIVTALKTVEAIFKKRFKATEDELQKLLVLALYEINARITSKRDDHGVALATQLTEPECEYLVDSMVKQLGPGKKIFDLQQVIEQAEKDRKDLQGRISTVQEQVARLQLETREIKDKNAQLQTIILDKEQQLQRQGPPAPTASNPFTVSATNKTPALSALELTQTGQQAMPAVQELEKMRRMTLEQELSKRQQSAPEQAK